MDPQIDFHRALAAPWLTYGQYLDLMGDRAAADPAGLPADLAEKVSYTGLNLHRSGRIARTWRPSRELAEALARITSPQTWLAITEPWCGDSAQCLPQIALLAEANPLVDLRVILRDENPEVMDRFLTDGKRSIPVLAAFAPEGRLLFRWGPRPAPAQAVFAAAQTEGQDKSAILERLHLFYGRDRGQALDAELTALLGGRQGEERP